MPTDARAAAIRRLNDGSGGARLALIALGVDPSEIAKPQISVRGRSHEPAPRCTYVLGDGRGSRCYRKTWHPSGNCPQHRADTDSLGRPAE